MFLFPQPTGSLSGSSFFAGYTMYYNFLSPDSGSAGIDTIGLECTINGNRISGQYTVSARWYDTVTYDTTHIIIDTFYDTTVIVQNATLWQDGQWHDNFTQNDSLFNDLAIYPIVVAGFPNGVKGVSKNTLTFYGNYPNPATENTELIHFSLNSAQNIDLLVYTLTGTEVDHISLGDAPAGDQLLKLDVSHYAAGQYIYLLRTGSGDGFGGKIVVAR
jgi:hypothetical protein